MPNTTPIPTWWQQPNFRQFIEQYEKAQSVLLFVGSGISISAGLPNWHDLLLRLAERYDGQYNPTNRIYPHIEAKVRSSPHESDAYEEAGTDLEEAYSKHDSSAWRDALREIVGNRTIQPSPLHEAVVRLKWTKAITSNYDLLLDRAAEAHLHMKPRVVTPWSKDLLNSQPANELPPYIVKIHGDIDLASKNSELVLSHKSFKDLYKGDNPEYKQVLHTLLLSAELILFIGYSHDDKYAKNLYLQIMENASKARFLAYSIAPIEGDIRTFATKMRQREQELPGVRFITYSLDDHGRHDELLDLIQYLGTPAPRAQDDEYRRREITRRPTVVLLHCGGTIGATPPPDADPYQPLKVMVKESRFDPELHEFSTKLLGWYKDAYSVASDIDLDIIWETLPREFQMFSENASPKLWNGVCAKLEQIIYKYFHASADLQRTPVHHVDEDLGKLFAEEDRQYQMIHEGVFLNELRFRSDFMQRYVMGIVVLFGTDTLAYAASAMALNLQHLPCPIVITGANQPPDGDNILESRAHFMARSDAWTNLQLSLLFLQCYGHRLTELFVSFGGTIHNGINLRKRATDIIPTDRGRLNTFSEPFSFRNLSLRGQYMFKLVEGVFCDNFYSHLGLPNVNRYADLVKLEADIRHIRKHALALSAPTKTLGDPFSERVAYFEVSPAFPPIDVQALMESGVWIVLAEGYASGTYPSIDGHPFTRFIAEARTHGMPIFLVSRYGILASMQEYDVAGGSDQSSPIVPLYEIVTETALPLLSLAAERISVKAWEATGLKSNETLVSRRIKLVKDAIHKIVSRYNILTVELEDVASKDGMLNARKRLQTGNGGEAVRKWEKPFQTFGEFPTNKRTARRRNDDETFAILARSDLFTILDGYTRVFEKVLAGPDGLEQVCNIGFDIGVPLWDSFRRRRDRHKKSDATAEPRRFFERKPAEQQMRIAKANEALNDVCDLIDTAGLGRARKPVDVEIHHADRAFSTNLVIVPFGGDAEKNSRYSVVTFSPKEKEFFSLLMSSHQDPASLDKLFHERLENTWVDGTSTVDWFFLGLFKGVFCAIAEYLACDWLTAQAGPDSGQATLRSVLRKRIKTVVNGLERSELNVTYEYVELRTLEEERA